MNKWQSMDTYEKGRYVTVWTTTGTVDAALRMQRWDDDSSYRLDWWVKYRINKAQSRWMTLPEAPRFWRPMDWPTPPEPLRSGDRAYSLRMSAPVHLLRFDFPQNRFLTKNLITGKSTLESLDTLDIYSVSCT